MALCEKCQDFLEAQTKAAMEFYHNHYIDERGEVKLFDGVDKSILYKAVQTAPCYECFVLSEDY